MESADAIRLVKLLNQTFSDSDAEALTAMRMANSLVKKRGGLWDQVIPVQIAHQSATESGELTIDLMFDVMMSCTHGAYEFVESLWNFYEDRGYLTEKQEQCLRKIYGAHQRKGFK